MLILHVYTVVIETHSMYTSIIICEDEPNKVTNINQPVLNHLHVHMQLQRMLLLAVQLTNQSFYRGNLME